MTKIKKGDGFLPDFSKEKLKELYNKEKNAKAKLRLLTAIKRKDGETLQDIANSLKKPKTTIHNWLKRLTKNLNGLYDIKQKGNRRYLTSKQKDEIKKILENSPEKEGLPFILWTTKLVQYLIFKKFQISYCLSAIWKLVKKMNFSLKVPRQEHKKANKKLQEEFKVELKKKFNITLNLDLRSSVLMKHTLS